MNSSIRTAKITTISKKIQEKRMNWYGRIMRRDQYGHKNDGSEYDWKETNQTEEDCLKDDLRERGLSGEEVEDRALWKRLVKDSDPIET